jgi:ribosome-binding protein aMBF1 (putative translation factor)
MYNVFIYRNKDGKSPKVEVDNMTKDEKTALNQAEKNLSDIKERGESSLVSWSEVRKDLYTSEEILASDLRVALMTELINARNKKGLSQRDLEELSGVKQPIISRMEAGVTTPQLDTVLKVLASLGKTLYVGDLHASTADGVSNVSETQEAYNAN